LHAVFYRPDYDDDSDVAAYQAVCRWCCAPVTPVATARTRAEAAAEVVSGRYAHECQIESVAPRDEPRRGLALRPVPTLAAANWPYVSVDFTSSYTLHRLLGLHAGRVDARHPLFGRAEAALVLDRARQVQPFLQGRGQLAAPNYGAGDPEFEAAVFDGDTVEVHLTHLIGVAAWAQGRGRDVIWG
jgi:hypothetical protein